MKIEVQVTDELVETILVTAFDGSVGGSWYWCMPFGNNWLQTTDELWSSVTIWIQGEDAVVTVDRAVVERGLGRLVTGEVGIRSDLLEQVTSSLATGDYDIDADAADCIVQAGVFGKVVYG